MSLEKLLKGATPEMKFEVSVNTLTQVAKTQVLIACRLSELMDRLDTIVKRLEARSWEKAINTELDRREKERASS